MDTKSMIPLFADALRAPAYIRGNTFLIANRGPVRVTLLASLTHQPVLRALAHRALGAKGDMFE